MLSDVPCELSSAARYHDGHEQRYNFPFYVLSFHTDSYPQLVKCKYLRFVLTLTYCSNRYTVDTDYTVWTNGSDFIRYTMTVRTDQTGFQNQIGFACSVNKDFLLKGTERFWVSSHFTWQRWGTVSPWWRKPMMLDSCPQRRHSASAWESYRWSHLRNKARSCRGVDFTLVSETRQDSWIPTVKEPLLYTDRTPMRPCPHTQLTRQLSSPTLQHMIVTLCRRRENDFLDCLYTQKTSTVKVTAE